MNISPVIYFMPTALAYNRIQKAKAIIIVLKKTQCNGLEWIRQGQGSSLVNMIIYLQILQRERNILTSWSNISFSRRAEINRLASQHFNYGLQADITVLYKFLFFLCSSHRSRHNYFKCYDNSFVEFREVSTRGQNLPRIHYVACQL